MGEPTVGTLKAEQLTFDKRLQHRAKLTDENTVSEYAADMKGGAKFPPLSVVHEKAGKDTPENFWVFDGFQRGGAYALNGEKSIPVEVYEGTFSDAFFLSLRSNGDNSILPRTADDKMRAIDALLDSPEAFAIVADKAKVKGSGGLHRLIALATGCSSGWVDKSLERRGQSVQGDKLVKRRAATAKPGKNEGDTRTGANGSTATQAADPVTEPVQAEQPVVSEADQRAKTAAAYAVVKAAGFSDRVSEAHKLVKRLGMIVSTLVSDDLYGGEVRKMLGAYKLGLSDDFDARAQEQGENFQPYYEILELWTPTRDLGAVFSLLKRRADSAKTDAKGGSEAQT